MYLFLLLFVLITASFGSSFGPIMAMAVILMLLDYNHLVLSQAVEQRQRREQQVKCGALACSTESWLGIRH
jgi:hypothetical protein